jgi:hypothetical protein
MGNQGLAEKPAENAVVLTEPASGVRSQGHAHPDGAANRQSRCNEERQMPGQGPSVVVIQDPREPASRDEGQ